MLALELGGERVMRRQLLRHGPRQVGRQALRHVVGDELRQLVLGPRGERRRLVRRRLELRLTLGDHLRPLRAARGEHAGDRRHGRDDEQLLFRRAGAREPLEDPGGRDDPVVRDGRPRSEVRVVREQRPDRRPAGGIRIANVRQPARWSRIDPTAAAGQARPAAVSDSRVRPARRIRSSWSSNQAPW